MARTLVCDFRLANWYSEIDWRQMEGRSIVRLGSPSNAQLGATSNPDAFDLAYYPGQSTDFGFVQLLMRKIRAILGYRSLVLYAGLDFQQGDTSPSSGTAQVQIRSFFKTAGYPDINDCNFQYKDIGTSTPWYGSGYAAQLGYEVSTDPIATALLDRATAYGLSFGAPFDIAAYLQSMLLDNEDLWLEFMQVTSSDPVFLAMNAGSGAYRPVLTLNYFHPIEMFPKHPTLDQIDMSRLLNTENQPIDLGAYEKNQTGAAVAFYVKNLSRSAVAHSEVWDDHPQWTPPVADPGNGGSGDIAYVEPFEDCVSQRWEVKMLSATTFEVKATAYLDNITSLHPSYDGTPAWQGATSSNWDSPDGSLRIPTAAWSGTPATNDLFVTYTRGQTTLTSWPADSNEQVQMCRDSGGSPDGNWRPINGRRILSTASVTIDAASKTISVEHIDTTDWPTNNKAFIYSNGNLDEGYVSSVTANSVTLAGLTITNNVHAAGAIVATTLPFPSLAASPWALLTAASGVSQTNKDRLYIANATSYGFTGGKTVFVQSRTDPATYEERVISTVQTGYIVLSTNLVNDYEIGAAVIEIGTGETKFYLRVVSLAVTNEEKKEFRLNVIA